jgi:methylmalonyl-CoA/ethylmalonyl-CoA epimerase
VCVADIDAALDTYGAVFGLEGRERETSAALATEAVLVPIGEGNLELISPRGNPGLEKFLEKRGPGLHHIALEVEGLDAALLFLKSLGVPLIDETPKVGARGHRIAFVHPKATGGVLVELVEPSHPTT